MTAPQSVDARGDVYALGCVAYFLLTGEHVFSGATVMEICMRYARTEPMPPSERLGLPVPEDLETLVLDCLRKAPEERPADGRALLHRLTAFRGLGDWKGAEWWEEYGEVVRAQAQDTKLTPTAFGVDLRGR